MAHFTQLDDQAVTSLGAEFSLGTLHSWKSIAAGTINSNYQVDTSEGRFFLRVNEGKSKEEVVLEISVLSHIVAQGVPSPLPKRSQSGEAFACYQGKFISVFDWMPGSHVDAQSITSEHCWEAGRALALLHKAGKSMDLSDVGEGRYSHAKIAALFEGFAGDEDPALAQVIPLLAAEFAWLEERAPIRAAAERSLIHADLFPDNVLVEGTKVVALLDFEQACVGSLVYDLAVAVNAWCFAEELENDRVGALVSGYYGELGRSPEDFEALKVELRAAALRFTVTRITDVYLPARREGRSVVGKDYRRFQMRLETWQGLSHDELSSIADLAQPPR